MPAPDPAPRADKRRNREALLAAADELIARDGAAVSLEEVARRAGVGSATLHRHFPGRFALLQAVFHERVASLCAGVEDGDPGAALVQWLADMAVCTAQNRGLAAALMADGGPGVDPQDTCHGMVGEVTGRLYERASRSGAIRGEVSAEDLLQLTCALASSQEGDARRAEHLVRIAVRGAVTG